MSDAQDLRHQFWSELSSTPFVMLGIAGVDDGHSQPMAAQFDDDLPDEIYFYTNVQNRLVKGMKQSTKGVFHFASKGHDFYASGQGTLSTTKDRALIERFWSPIVAAWYDEGPDDPDLVMLKLDLTQAELWNNSTGTFVASMLYALTGDRADKVAQEENATVRFG